MSYGLRVYAGNNILQIDSNVSMVGMVGSATGAGTSATIIDGSLLFVNYAPGSGNSMLISAVPSAASSVVIGGVTYSRTTYTFKGYDFGEGTHYSSITCNYMVVTPTKRTTGDSSSYGLVVYDGTGTAASDIVFDSRTMGNFGFKLTEFLIPGGSAGGPTWGDSPIGLKTEYFCVNNSYYSYTNDSEFFFYNSVWFGNNDSVFYGGTNHAVNGMYFVNLLVDPFFGGGAFFPNTATQLIGAKF